MTTTTTGIGADQEYRMVPVAELTPHPENHINQGDLGKIIESIEVNGWYGACLVQKSSGHVIAGNHRLQAAIHLGITEVPVIWKDVDDRRAVKILVSDNASARAAVWDDDGLAEILSMFATDSEGLAGTGFDGDDLDDLIAQANQSLDVGAEKKGSSFNVVVRCENESEQDATLQKLLAAGYDAKVR